MTSDLQPTPDPDAVTAAFPTIGPFDSDTSQAAARALDNLSRYLVYATATAAGIPDPNTLDVVLRNLNEALERMPNVLRGLHRRFTELSRHPDAYLYRDARFDAEEAPETLHEARTWFASETEAAANLLADATVHLAELASLASKLGINTDE